MPHEAGAQARPAAGAPTLAGDNSYAAKLTAALAEMEAAQAAAPQPAAMNVVRTTENEDRPSRLN